mgnify:CR=1 FL=1
MERLKLLIAEGTEEFRSALEGSLRGIYRVLSCGEGNEALKLMRSFRPDVVILDLMMPGLDGITILERTVASGLHPMVLATTCYYNPYVLDAIQRLGVGYLMVKPCDIQATIARLGDLRQRLQQPVISRADPKVHVSNLLLALGIPTKLKGYGYLREAVLLMAEDPKQSITKELYPAVAAACDGDRKNVERSIRSAIEKAWLFRDENYWKLYFPVDGSGMTRRPTNSEFITRLADTLHMDEEIMEA